MSGVLVGPLPQIRFADGSTQVYAAPRDTLDLRYVTCTVHHPACDCREALFAEDRQELRGAWREVSRYRDWAKAVARLHQRQPNEYLGDRCAECTQAWPCATWKLTADADWLTRVVERLEGGRFT